MVLPELSNNGGLHPRLSADELTVYFYTSNLPADLWSARRSSLTEPFETPALLAAQSSPADDYDPMISTDGLTLWFISARTAGEGARLYVSTRPSMLAELGPPALAAAVNAADRTQADAQPFLTADQEELWFSSTRAGGAGGFDLWRAEWAGAGFTAPVVVPELSSPANDWVPTLSADRRTVYFSSMRPAPGGQGEFEIWRSHRAVVSDGFPTPTLVEELNTASSDFATWISADDCRIYGGSRDANGVTRIFMATRQP